MRKMDPKGVRGDFDDAVADVGQALGDVVAANVTQKTRKLVAESSFLSAAVLWEGFVSDIFVAYVNRDFSAYSRHAQAQLKQHAESKWGADVVRSVDLDLKSHIKADRVRQLLDNRGFNVTFKSSDDMVARASDWLAARYANRFGALAASDKASIDASSAIRNYLAHRSKSSKARMDTALVDQHLPQHLKRGAHKIHDVGSFLIATPVGAATRRVDLYLDALRAAASTICP